MVNRIFIGLKKKFQPFTITNKDTSENLTKAITEISLKNKKALENINEKKMDMMNDKGTKAPYLTSSLVNLFTPENKSQFRLLKALNSTKMKGFLINISVLVTLHSNMLTFRDTNKSFKLDRDLLKIMTNYNLKADQCMRKLNLTMNNLMKLSIIITFKWMYQCKLFLLIKQ